jgi:hypothetical protein
MKSMIAMFAAKMGIRAAYYIAGKVKARFVTAKVHEEIDRALEKARLETNGDRGELKCGDV